MELNNARILITGGSLGIGRETAKELCESGAQVVITAREGKRLQSTAEEIGAIPVVGDVSVKNDIDKIYQTVKEKLGGLDCLINNAGIGASSALVDIKAEDMERIWRVNVLGPTLMAKYASKIFIEQKHGTIVNISSTAGLKGYAGGSIYSSSKFALQSLSQCWRAELRKYNIRIITINPSEVTTAFGSTNGVERVEQPNKLRATEIAHAIKASLEMDDRGFIPDLVVHATNPW